MIAAQVAGWQAVIGPANRVIRAHRMSVGVLARSGARVCGIGVQMRVGTRVVCMGSGVVVLKGSGGCERAPTARVSMRRHIDLANRMQIRTIGFVLDVARARI